MFFGTYRKKLGRDGRVTVPRELRAANEGYEGFWPLLSLEYTDQGNRFLYLHLKPANGDANLVQDGKLWLPPVARELINPYGERELVFLGVNDHAELWSASNWDLWEKEYLPRFAELIEKVFSRRQDIEGPLSQAA